MPGVRVDISPEIATRKKDLSSWIEVDLAHLRSKQKRSFNKRKSALVAYFTTDTSIEEIALEYHLSPAYLQKLAQKCLLQHEDGMPWGFRALLPGAVIPNDASPTTVVESRIQPEKGDDEEATTKRQAVKLSSQSSQNVEMQSVEPPEAIINQDLKNEEKEPSAEESAENVAAQLISLVEEAPALPFKDEGVQTSIESSSNNIEAGLPIALHPSAIEIKHYRITGKKVTSARRLIHKRSKREVREYQKQRRLRRIISSIVVAALVITILLPLGTGFAAYSAYNNIRGLAYDGLNQLLNVKSLLTTAKTDPVAVLNAQTLLKARTNFDQAENDFTELQQLVSRPDIQNAVEQFASNYSGQLDAAQRLVQVGLDVSRMGSEMSAVALIGANILHGSPLASGSNKPLITTADIANAEGALVHSLYYIDDIQLQMSQVSLKDLPISDKQKTQLTSVLVLLPKAKDTIVQAQGLIGIVSWLLGVGHQRRFLVQTLDRAELRPSGGFTGQYGVLEIQDGRMAPFSLHDVNTIDYNGNGVELYRQAPPEYRSWMNFGNWGLRDSNLSGDYPTTAKISMQVFQDEGGGPVDGDISFTPTLISHILDVTGPVKVAGYNEIITSKNLEDRLHYYQQDFSAIAIQEQKTGVKNASARKTFTTLLGRILLDRVRHLQVKQLVALAKNALKDIQSHDLEIYFANPDAEAWLVQHGYSGATDTFTKNDGFMVVQANISISKATQYVHTTEQDTISLDAQGGATHVLTITLDYRPTGPVYGFDTYADYIRVYAPPNAQFLYGDGFDSGQALCTPGASPPPPLPTSSPPGGVGGSKSTPGPGGTGGNPGTDTSCASFKTSFPSAARYCPNGNYDLGQRGYIAGKGLTNWPYDQLGGPTALTSDLPGRSMWGGLTETPKWCTSYITLSWYVPHAVKNVAGQFPYSLLVQKQGGYIPTVQITIDTSGAGINGLKPFDFTGDLTADKVFSLAMLKKK